MNHEADTYMLEPSDGRPMHGCMQSLDLCLVGKMFFFNLFLHYVMASPAMIDN